MRRLMCIAVFSSIVLALPFKPVRAGEAYEPSFASQWLDIMQDVAGNEIQKHYDKPVEGQQIFVRTSGGVLVSVTQPTSNLRVGQKVYIEGSGTEARVIAQ